MDDKVALVTAGSRGTSVKRLTSVSRTNVA
jgi:hypothetical protein